MDLELRRDDEAEEDKLGLGGGGNDDELHRGRRWRWSSRM